MGNRGKKSTKKGTKQLPRPEAKPVCGARRGSNASVDDIDNGEITDKRSLINDSAHLQEDDSVQDKSQQTKLLDMEIRTELEHTSPEDRARLLATWAETYSSEVKQTLKIGHSVLRELMAQVSKKFKEAGDQFRTRNGAADSVVLSPLQAITIHEAYLSAYTAADLKSEKLKSLTQAIQNRNSIIHNLNSVNNSYRKKLQDLMWVAMTKKFFILESVFSGPGKRPYGTEVAALKVSCELQSHKIELLEAQLSTLSEINCMAYQELKALDAYLRELKAPQCHSKIHQPNRENHEPMHWHSFLASMEGKKREVFDLWKAELRYEVKHLLLRGSQDWELFEMLFNYVSKLDCTELEGYCRKVYGDAIEMTPRPSVADLKKPSFRAILSHIKSQSADELQQEIKNNKRIDELFDLSRLDDYFLSIGDNHIVEVDNVELTPMKALEAMKQNLQLVLDENKYLRASKHEVELVADEHARTAVMWRGNYDLHLSNCKKQATKDGILTTELHEWINGIITKFSPPDKNLALLSDKEKVAMVTAGVKNAMKDHDNSVRKIEDVNKKLLQKDKIIDEKENELARARDGNRTHEDAMKQKIIQLEMKVAERDLELCKAHKAVDKANDDCEKKLQRALDKYMALKKESKLQRAEHEVVKLDLDATHTQLEIARSGLEASRTQLDNQCSQLEKMSLEQQENRSALLSLRTNKAVEKDIHDKAVQREVQKKVRQAVDDAVKDALRNADGEKDEELIQLRAAFEILERDRTADWKSIQELSRWKDDIARRDRDIERKDQEIVIKDHEMDMQRQEFSNYRMAAEATEQRMLGMAFELSAERSKVLALQNALAAYIT